MCGRITLLYEDELADILEAIALKRRGRALARAREAQERAQARVGGKAPVVVASDDGVAAETFTWGIEAPWNKKLIFNTRLESALGGSGMWESAIREGRCIVPAATFFETQSSQSDSSSEAGRSRKSAYEFSRRDGEPLLLASVLVDGRFSIVTTQPNADVAPVHPRMPLALHFQEASLWLDGSLEDIASLGDRSSMQLSRTLDASRRNGSPQPAGQAGFQLSLF